MAYERDNVITCEEARVASFMYMKDDPSLTAQQREEFVTHLLVCPACAEEYEENKWLIGVLKRHWLIGNDTKNLLHAAGPHAGQEEGLCTCGKPYRLMTLEESWERLKNSCPSLAEAYRHGEHKLELRRAAWRIVTVAAAACILIAIGVGWMMMRHGSDRKPALAYIASDHEVSPIAFAEFVTAQGRKPLALNQPVATGDRSQEILLGGMHRVVMNRNTIAVVKAASITASNGGAPGVQHEGDNDKVPYLIQLDQGELYVEVVPGNPFTVKTNNARLDITGTKFDVSTDGEMTNLTLLKGSIRFSGLDHQQQPVSVTAGFASTITGRQAPSAPVPADAVARTAWAGQTVLTNAMALAAGQADVHLATLSQDLWRQPAPPDVDTLDYSTWRDDHSEFSHAFPSLAVIGKIQAVKADWIQLLMTSGDIWQFRYDPKLPARQPLTILEPAAVARFARNCGVKDYDIQEACGLPDLAPLANASTQYLGPGQEYGEALRRWHDALAGTGPEIPKNTADLKIFSLRASQYIADSRTAAYLWAKTHPKEVRQLLVDCEYVAAALPTPHTAIEKVITDERIWLKQLRDQATAARNCVPAAMDWLIVPATTACTNQATEQQRRLAELVAEVILPQESKE